MSGLLILDLDGTLFRTETATVLATQRTFHAFGLPGPSAAEICAFIGRPSSEWHSWLRSHCPAGVAADVVAAVDRNEMELVVEAGELYPGVPEALAALRAAVEQMAICSNGPQDYVERVLQSQGVAAHFDAVRCHQVDGDDKPGMVAELLERLAARPGVVIGDRRDDIVAAHRNGLQAIAAAYGYGAMEELGEADAIASAPRELPELVRAILMRET